MKSLEEQEAIAEKIEKLGDERKYQEQAEAFMEYTGTKIEAVEAVPQTAPRWAKEGEKHGKKYSVTMKNESSTYIFPYWGSVADREMVEMAKVAREKGGTSSKEYFAVMDFIKREAPNIIPKNHFQYAGMVFIGRLVDTVETLVRPSKYDILACLSPMWEDNFEDFCASYGYDVDSRTAYKTYNAVLEQDRAIRKLFTAEELELLQMIN